MRLTQRLGRRGRALLVCLLLLLVFKGVVYGVARWVPLPARLQAKASTVLRYHDGRLMHVFLSEDEKIRIASKLSQVDPQYRRALIRLEDKRFYWHSGVDLFALGRAFFLNLSKGHVVSGASTLSMQVARLAEPKRRSYRAKFYELLRALQLEALYSKDEILELYLQLVPYGGNVEGVQAASWAYFGHDAERLSAAEIAILLAVPQDPTGRHPSPANRRRLQKARDQIVEKLVAVDVLPDGPGRQRSLQERRSQILALEVPEEMRDFPREAPHASLWMKRKYPGQFLEQNTSLDRGAQELAQGSMVDARRLLFSKGIHNGAMVVIENESAKVRALIGGMSFSSEDAGGQIAAFDQPRSPGSALKPVIYGLALDRGLALSEHLVADVPVDYRGYSPHNYDGRFLGLVRLEDALSKSLNIPFVNLLKRVGVENFIGSLRDLGAKHLVDSPGFYGLSAAIGAVEMSPLEMAGVYLALANQGKARPLRFFERQDPNQENRGSSEGLAVVSPGASFQIARALKRRDRPDFPGRRRVAIARGVFWKTGTSYGHRDAWAIGVGDRYTVAVWLGNLDNSPSVALVGAGAAGPILFDLLEALEPEARQRPPLPPPSDLSKVRVCTYSGFLPGPACDHTEEVLALTEHVPTATCPYHVSIDIDVESGLRLRPGCREGHDYRTQSFLRWPATVRRFLKKQRLNLPEPPRLSPECGEPEQSAPPRILSPPAGMTALLRSDLSYDQQEIPLEAECPSGSQRLAWFVDGAFIGETPARERLFWQPSPGKHELLVEDDNGQSASRTLEVKALQ